MADEKFRDEMEISTENRLKLVASGIEIYTFSSVLHSSPTSPTIIFRSETAK